MEYSFNVEDDIVECIFIQAEARLFILLAMIFLFAFIRITFDCVSREHNFNCIFSIAGTIFSIFGLFGNMTMPFFALSGVCYAVSAFFMCKYTFEKHKVGSKGIKRIVFFILSAAIAALAFYSLCCGSGAIVYIVFLALLGIFALDQFNKIRIDKLTGLYNRYGMDIELKKQLWQYKREHTDSFYLIACDLDRFKHINDEWGHLEGDRALKLVSEALSNVSERFDSEAFRIGGDEFVIITDTSEEGLATEITKAVKKEFDKIEFRDDFDINISIGTALYDGVTSIETLFDNADKKLYQAKRKAD